VGADAASEHIQAVLLEKKSRMLYYECGHKVHCFVPSHILLIIPEHESRPRLNI
jgi:hypothetical protein